MKTKAWMLALAASATLAACGGGGDTPPVTERVYSEANTSVASFIGYLRELVVADADGLEPVDVSAVTPATSDTTEPDPLI